MSSFTTFLSLRDNSAQTSYSNKVTQWEDKESDYTIIQHYRWWIYTKTPAVGRKMINISIYRLFCFTVILIHLKWVEEGGAPLLYQCLDDDDTSRRHINYIWPTRRFVPPERCLFCSPGGGPLTWSTASCCFAQQSLTVTWLLAAVFVLRLPRVSVAWWLKCLQSLCSQVPLRKLQFSHPVVLLLLHCLHIPFTFHPWSRSFWVLQPSDMDNWSLFTLGFTGFQPGWIGVTTRYICSWILHLLVAGATGAVVQVPRPGDRLGLRADV